MELYAIASDELIDSIPSIAVSGAPSESVQLTVSTVDAAGHRWRSVGGYRVGDDNTLHLPDPERPWWDMAIDGDSPVAFQLNDDHLDYDMSVSSGSGTARTTVTRLIRRGNPPEQVAGNGWSMWIYRPPDAAGPSPAVLLIPGTTGPATLRAIAALLASRGYLAAVLRYYGGPGMVTELNSIPVELFLDAAQHLSHVDGADAGRLAVYAVSVGTMAALAFAQPQAPRVAAMILVAPSSVVWQALSERGRPPKAPALSVAGTPVPYVTIRGDKILGQILRHAILGRLSRRPRSRALTLLPAYRAGLVGAKNVAEAMIPIENVRCPLMTIAGTDDAMWPAISMAQNLHRRRVDHGTEADDVSLEFTGAGHFFRPPITPTTVLRNESLVAGGEAEASARAQRQAWDATLAFLARHL